MADLRGLAGLEIEFQRSVVSDLLVAAALGPFFLISQGWLLPPKSPGSVVSGSVGSVVGGSVGGLSPPTPKISTVTSSKLARSGRVGQWAVGGVSGQ